MYSMISTIQRRSNPPLFLPNISYNGGDTRNFILKENVYESKTLRKGN